MTSDYMAASSQFLYLAPIEEPRGAYKAGRNQEVRFPPKLVEHVRNVEQCAHAAIVKRQQERAVLWRPDEQLGPSGRLAAGILSDRHQVSTELGAIQFV
jgi:hypothetical protein